MATNAVQRLALLFLGLFVSQLSFLSVLVPFDAAVQEWVQAHRSCTLDHLASFLNVQPIIALVFLGLLTLVWLSVQRRWSEARQAILVVILGGLLSEVFKLGFERARPSVLPPLLSGNSFPSGHVSGALLIAGTLGFVLARQQWARAVKFSGTFVLVSLVGVVTWQRLYLGRHWVTDILGSFLLVGAWLCFVLSRPAILVLRHTVVVSAVLLTCYLGFYFFPQARLTLPSVRSSRDRPLLDFSFGEPTQLVLTGAWGGHTREPVGPITWMKRGEAHVALRVPEHHAYALKLAARPFLQSKMFACFPLEIQVNARPVGLLLLYRGWREYTLHLEPTWIVPGTNWLTFRPGADFPGTNPQQPIIAFRYLHLFAETR